MPYEVDRNQRGNHKLKFLLMVTKKLLLSVEVQGTICHNVSLISLLLYGLEAPEAKDEWQGYHGWFAGF